MTNLGARSRLCWRLPVIVSCAWATLGTAAIRWPGRETQVYEANRLRLERMTPDQRSQIWAKHQEFLARPAAERDRIRRLNADLEKLPADKRERYRSMMDRYLRWKRTLPLYQQHMLEDAAVKGSAELYAIFRDVQARKENEDRQRDYWFVPDAAPGIRKAIPRILPKLSAEEIEELDQTPPLERSERLIATAQRLGFEPPPPGVSGMARPLLRGPLPPPDKEKLREFLETLPREQLEELGDLGLMKKTRERQLFNLYYRHHPEELPPRLRRFDGNQEGDRPIDRNQRKDPAKTPMKGAAPPGNN